MKESKRYKVYKGIDLDDEEMSIFVLDTKKNAVAAMLFESVSKPVVECVKFRVNDYGYVEFEYYQESIDKATLIGEF